MKNKIAVFCGSACGNNPEYIQAANQLAELLVAREIGLVYGGANVGLMGVLANRMLELGGEVIGVIPDFLVDMEIAHTTLSQLHIVASMHERKIMMMDLADSFILLPGGAGSLDEFFEVMTLVQLGYSNKILGVINVANYFDLMLAFLRHAVSEEFLKAVHLQRLIVEDSPEKLLQVFFQHENEIAKSA